MDELAEILGDDADAAGMIFQHIRDAFSVVMDTNCYQVTPVEFDKKICFSVSLYGSDHVLVTCTHQQLVSIAIRLEIPVSHNRYKTIDFLLEIKDMKVRINVNGVGVTNVKVFNPMPVVNHCLKIIQELHLPKPLAEPICHVVEKKTDGVLAEEKSQEAPLDLK